MMGRKWKVGGRKKEEVGKSSPSIGGEIRQWEASGL